MADAELTQLLDNPQFQRAFAQHAQRSGVRDPIQRVRHSVHSVVKQMMPGREEDISNRAAQHAAAAAQVADEEQKKVSKGHVNYRPGSVPQHCGNCKNYRDHHCSLVRGVIDPSAVCTKWEKQTPGDLLDKARRAPDGHHYVPDPNRPGGYARLVPKNQQPASPTGRGPVMPGGSGSGPQGAATTAGAPSPPQSTPAAGGQPMNGNMRDLLFIRHGETDLNDDRGSVDRIRGHEDIPLNQKGIQQAHDTGQKLRAQGVRPDALVSSDLSRSAETAKLISHYTGAPIAEVSDGFRPWDAGKLTGQRSDKAVPIMAQFAEHRPDTPLPDGESFHAFTGRFLVHLANALQRNPGLLGVVAHHRNERTLHAWRAKGFPVDGSIDLKTFNQKGEQTGAAQHFKIPMDRLIAAARYISQRDAQTPGDAEPANFDAATENEKPGQE
jgi:probable phosphoglycerate mutase